jgi:hypothetical protein
MQCNQPGYVVAHDKISMPEGNEILTTINARYILNNVQKPPRQPKPAASHRNY